MAIATVSDWKAQAEELRQLLGFEIPAVAITFQDHVNGTTPFGAPLAPPAADGRTGSVAAGCVFWMHATDRTFSTVAADHGNCSVGMMTHGLATLDEVAGNADVAEILASGWVSMEAIPGIPVVKERAESIVYGPLAETAVDPDVVLLRLSARQLMVLSDALPGLRIEGKPQCHIVAAAKEQGEVVASVGCQLSRVRTGMSNQEMTCAIPARRLAEVLGRLRSTARADRAVARYAADDAKRF